MSKEILIEGLTEAEILALPHAQIEQLILTGTPIVFRAGTATILGEFSINGETFVVELAQIEGGGEGVLLTLGTLSKRFAQLRGLRAVQWIVQAIHCAKPNLKLKRVLDRRGFVVEEINGIAAYRLLERFV